MTRVSLVTFVAVVIGCSGVADRVKPHRSGDRRDLRRIARGPWLVAPAPDGVTVLWESDAPAAARLLVDAGDGGGAARAFDAGDGVHHLARARGLLPARAYHYRIELDGALADAGELATAPADASAPVRFVVYGDTRSDGDAHARVISAVRAAQADFAVITGDLVASSTPGNWQRFFDIEHSLLKATPIYPVFGNHESDSGGADRFDELFPVGGAVYSFDYGAVHVAVLDSNSSMVGQAKWLDCDLSTAAARGLRHAVVVMHRGPFSAARAPGHGPNVEARDLIVPVARAHHVDAVIGGHDHVYERGESNGLTYFVSGGGGAPLAVAHRDPGTRVARSLYHFLVFDVTAARLQVTACDESGAPFDRVELPTMIR